MKNLRLLITAVCLSMGIMTHAQTKTETIKVAGNCGSCQKHIEKAAKEAGATKAQWDKKKKVLTVTYDASKTSNDAIQKKVAAVGYDTENYPGDINAYNSLEECCQYDGKKK